MVKSRLSFKRVVSSFSRIQYLAFIALVLSLSSCYNEPDFIGGNLIPQGDLASIKIDTSFELSAYTVKTERVDSISSSGFTYATLGCLNSPIFGKTKADFLTKVLLSTTRGSKPLFGTSPEIKSLTLSFSLNSFYGDKKTILNAKLYELKDTLSDYYYYYGLEPIDKDVLYYPTQIGTAIYTGDTLLTFVIDNVIGQKILNADLDSATVASNANFTNYFKGFYVTCDDIVGSNGVMYFFDFINTATTMKLTYIKPDKTDTTYTFSIGSTQPPARYNHFSHDYTQANPLYKIKNLDETEIQDSVFYVESLAGVKGLIKLDGIEEWLKKMPIAINYAELRIEPENYIGMPKDSTVDILYYSVDKRGLTSTQDQNIASDQSEPTYAKYNKAKKYYAINLTTHIQSILAGKVTDKSIYITPSLASSGRTVLRSGSHSKRMKLIITYTKL